MKLKKEIDEIKTGELNQICRKLIYETNKYTFNFHQLETIRSFGDGMLNGKIALGKANIKKQSI